ncbi:hypothetical protein KR215_004229, partial [Drosophila sulfurigaster]
NSTQVLHVVDNFQPNRSEDKFFDCLSIGDSDCKKCASKKISSCKSGRSAKGPNKSDSNRLDDPEALRAALERIAHGTQMMLKNFEQSKYGCRKPCNATLEITARLITDANDSGPNCHFQGRPVTMKMPLEFDPSTGQLGTKSVSSSRNVVCKQSCNNNQPLESNTGMVSSRFRKTRYRLSSLNAIDSEMFAGSCTPTGPVSSHDTQSKHMEAVVVPLTVPGLPPQLWEEKQAQSQSVYDNDSDFTTEVEWVQEPLPPLHDGEETRQIGEIGEISLKSDMDGLSAPLSRVHDSKRYYMALPQHRDFSNCSPCRFYPSPIMDEEGNVFCPGNCGCCQCAWKKRSFDDNRKHTNIKVCSCVQRGTIFSSYNQRENCSQISDFDFCPCREKAEAKFLELYNCEMWSSPTVTRGPEVRLDQIMELMTPTQPHSR